MKLFAHSAKDAYLIVLGVVQIALTIYGALCFNQLSLGMILALMALVVFLHCTNYQCIAHNFLHNAFFTSNFLNRLFSLVNSLAIGLSQMLYRCHHLHHHRYNNDDKDPQTGTTWDQTSTYRYSRVAGKEENIISYSFLSFFRQDTGFLIREAVKRGCLRVVIVESLAVLAFWAILGFLSWRGFVFFVLPAWYLGQCAAYWENYLEHHGAIPGNRMTDSVSCYNPFYNFIWFNNGYHQEHHYRPQVHWTEIAFWRDKMPAETERRVVKGAHWFNLNPPPRSKRCLAPPAAMSLLETSDDRRMASREG